MLTLVIAALVASAPEPGNAGMQRELGKTLFKQGRVEQAIERFQAAVQLNPQDAVAWYNLAYASRKAKRFEQAAEAYQRYTALSPEDPDGFFGLAESLRHGGRRVEAAAAYREYVAKEKRPTEQKWVDQAKARIAELEAPPPVPPAPDRAQVLAAPAVASAAAAPAVPASTAPAAAAPASAAAQKQADALAALSRADAAFAARDYRTALFAYQDVVLATPANVHALVALGHCYARLGHDPEAAAQWRKALELDPRNAEAASALAAVRDRHPDAAAPAAPAPPLATAPVDEAAARAHYTKAVALIRDHNYDEAAAELDQALSAKPAFAVALIARGSARIGQARYQDAIADYTAAQKADPSLAAPLFGLAEAFRGLGQYDKAAALYRQFAASTAPDAEPELKRYALQHAEALSPP